MSLVGNARNFLLDRRHREKNIHRQEDLTNKPARLSQRILSVVVLGLVLLLAAGLASRLKCSAMPNGHREPYRNLQEIPSPLHTSDSEDTYVTKRRWQVLAKWVLRRWRSFTQRKVLERRIRCLTENKLLPHSARQNWLVKTIIRFL